MLNTLSIVKKMTAAGMPVAQAEVFAQTLTETATEHLATKRDLQALGEVNKRDLQAHAEVTKRDLQAHAEVTKRDLQALAEVTKRDLQAQGEATKRDINELRDSTRRDISELRDSTKRDIKDLEIAMMHQMKEQLSSIERAMERMQFQMLRAGMAIGLGVVGAIGGLMRYVGK